MAAKRKEQQKQKGRHYILIPWNIRRFDCGCGYTFTLLTLIDLDVQDHDNQPHMEFLEQKPNYCPFCGARWRNGHG